MEWINVITGISATFWGKLAYALLFVVALGLILFFEKEKIKRYTFLWYTGLVLVFIYNPLTLIIGKWILKENAFEQYYLRFYSVIPVLIIVAYGLTLFVMRFQGKQKLIALVASLAVVCICGRCLYTEDWFTKAENRNKVPQDVITISDVFADYEGDTIRIMAPLDVTIYLRQIDSRFSMPYGREIDDIAYELTNPTPNPKSVADYCAENNVDYVVVSAAEDILNTYLNYGFELYGRTPYYAVLTPIYGDWILTEYDDGSDLQCMCYTMYNQKDGTLIVIDGGHGENDDTLRENIKALGGEVDAWIITHYHMDHIDAFNAIYEDPQGITIDQVYITPLDADLFYSVAQEWDDVDSFNKFQEITAEADNINYVQRDDVLTFSDDLTITFFNAFDDVVVDCREDIPNNDSLVFKMATPNRSILICGDCHSEYMANYLVKTYGDELKADILQCGHHGNNSMPTETGFYELVNPEVAIFDTTDAIMTSPNYTAGALAAYLSEAGVRLVWFKSAPNVFVFN